MAIIGDNGENYSFKSNDLINELKGYIRDFGNIDFVAFYEIENGAKLYVDFQYPEYLEEFDDDRLCDIVKADYLLKYFKKQNSIF